MRQQFIDCYEVYVTKTKCIPVINAIILTLLGLRVTNKINSTIFILPSSLSNCCVGHMLDALYPLCPFENLLLL